MKFCASVVSRIPLSYMVGRTPCSAADALVGQPDQGVRRGPGGPSYNAALSPVLAVLLAYSSTMSAQAPPAQPAKPAPTVQSLRVIPLAGNGEVNDLDGKVMAPLVVNVLDINGRPVEGAEVVFRFPISGPSATLPDNST